MSTQTLLPYRSLLNAVLRPMPTWVAPTLYMRRLCRLDPALAPTVKPTSLDIAFAAGFYEGEGCCYREPRTGAVRVCASQKGREMLDWLSDRFGGRAYSRCGGRSIFQWQITGARARGFLQTIYIFLSERRQRKAREVMRVGEFRPGVVDLSGIPNVVD